MQQSSRGQEARGAILWGRLPEAIQVEDFPKTANYRGNAYTKQRTYFFWNRRLRVGG
jgi:hypothetical protein